MTAFNPAIPQGNTFLSVDVNNIRNNFNQLNTTYAVDHIPLTQVANNGIHKQVNMLNQETPALLGDLNLYAQVANGVSALWAQNTSGSLPLFAGPANGSPNIGFTSMYGGIIIQWGFVNGTHGSAPKNFNPGDTSTVTFQPGIFPHACFGVWTQLNYNGTAPASTGNGNISIDTNSGTFSKTSFNWTAIINNSSKYTQFFWVAIGN
jgi:hypothetical protein